MIQNKMGGDEEREQEEERMNHFKEICHLQFQIVCNTKTTDTLQLLCMQCMYEWMNDRIRLKFAQNFRSLKVLRQFSVVDDGDFFSSHTHAYAHAYVHFTFFVDVRVISLEFCERNAKFGICFCAFTQVKFSPTHTRLTSLLPSAP